MLKIDRRRERSILTLGGTITYSRSYLRPVDKESKQTLQEIYHTASICPIDDFLGTSDLPFRITYKAALRIARIALNCSTLADAEYYVSDDFGERVSDDRIRQVLLYIGKLVYNDQVIRYTKALEEYAPASTKARKFRGRPAKNAYYLCMEISQVKENTFICRSCTVSYKNGEKSKWFLNYSVCTPDEYKKVLIAETIIRGLNEARELIIVTDGSDFIRDFCSDLFPFATVIIGLRFLRQRVLNLAEAVVKYLPNPLYRTDYFCRHAMEYIEAGKWDSVFEMNEIKKRQDNPGTEFAVNEFRSYIESNKQFLTYDIFQNRGYLIGKEPPTKAQATFEVHKLLRAKQFWNEDVIHIYLALYAAFLGDEWYSYVVPLVRCNYTSSTQASFELGASNDTGLDGG